MTASLNISAWAAALLAAYPSTAARQSRLPATSARGPENAAAAYAVQAAVWAAQAGAVRPTVWKVAAASRDSTPIAAPILPNRVFRQGGDVPAALFHQVGVEAELAFRFDADLPVRPAPYRADEIRAAIGSAHVALELVDTRLADAAAAGPFWRLADNLLNGGFVLGEAVPDWQALDLETLEVRVLAEGRCLADTRGNPPLGNPLHCLPWWVAHVGGVRAGDVVTTGAWNGMHVLAAPGTVRAEFVGLGQAAFSLRAEHLA